MKIIYDCDNTMGLYGKDVDDGLTLLYLYQQADVDLLGVTLTYGNGTLAEVVGQSKLLQQKFDLALPFYVGQAQEKVATPSAAARFLVAQARRYPHEITLLVTGSMANLAEAAALAPDFFHLIKGVVDMGGCFEPMVINGQVIDELNFSVAAESTRQVFTSTVPLTVVSGQYLLPAFCSETEILATLQQPKTPQQQWARDALIAWCEVAEKATGMAGFIDWDGLTALALLQPDAFDFETQWVDLNASSWTKGQLALASKETGRKVTVMTKMHDIPGAYQRLLAPLNEG